MLNILFILFIIYVFINYIFFKLTKKHLPGLYGGVFISVFGSFLLLIILYPHKFETGHFAYVFLLYAILDRIFYYKIFKTHLKVLNTPEKLNDLEKDEPFSKKFISLIAIIAFCKYFIIDGYNTPTGSMLPTIQLNKPYIFNKMAYGLNFPFKEELLFKWNEPERQDVVIFNYKKNDVNIPYLKRVIGIEGDTVYYDFYNKTLKIINDKEEIINEYHYVKKGDNGNDVYEEIGNNGHKHLIQKSLSKPTKISDENIILYGHVIPNILEIKVGKGEMFVMGDNRDESYDSRFFGVVKTNKLIGKMISF